MIKRIILVLLVLFMLIIPTFGQDVQEAYEIPFIAMTKPQLGITLKVEEWLMLNYNVSLVNAGNDQRQLCIDYPDIPHVIPIMGWTNDPVSLYESYLEYGSLNTESVYYYNCGIITDNWETAYSVVYDECGSHGAIPIPLRPYNYGQTARHLLDVKVFMPGLKTIATHPFNIVRDYRDDDNKIELPKLVADVYCIHISFLDQIEDLGGIPENAVLWAYIIDRDVRIRTEIELREIGDLLRKYEVEVLMVNDDDDIQWMGYMTPYGPRLTLKAVALFEGLKN